MVKSEHEKKRRQRDQAMRVAVAQREQMNSRRDRELESKAIEEYYSRLEESSRLQAAEQARIREQRRKHAEKEFFAKVSRDILERRGGASTSRRSRLQNSRLHQLKEQTKSGDSLRANASYKLDVPLEPDRPSTVSSFTPCDLNDSSLRSGKMCVINIGQCEYGNAADKRRNKSLVLDWENQKQVKRDRMNQQLHEDSFYHQRAESDFREYEESRKRQEELRKLRQANYKSELETQIQFERERSIRSTVQSMSPQEQRLNADILPHIGEYRTRSRL